MKSRLSGVRVPEHGFTLIEGLVATTLVVIFFAAIFELNAMCLRNIDRSKEGLAALQTVHDRIEALRNRTFNDLTRTTCEPCVDPPPPPPPEPPPDPCVTIPCVHDLMITPANPAPFSAKATETVTISNYPPTSDGVTQFRRSPNGNVTTISLRKDPVTEMVKVDVRVDWTMSVGAGTRSEQTSCLVAKGTKK
jgi:type II secretory pathway pseudopilin PulG